MKRKADELLLALSPSEEERVGVVRCAFQWAQNSTAIFLSVKFAHRWSSPGALKVYDEGVSVTECCFSFSAAGNHSQLRKRYSLDLHFLHDVNPERWSWQRAAAGRMTVEVQKKFPGRWLRLLKTPGRTGEMAVWEAMQARWQSDLEGFERFRKAEMQRAAAEPGSSDHGMLADAADEMQHEELEKACRDSRFAPFPPDLAVVRLCSAYWPPKLKGARGKGTLWLVLFHSPKAMKCGEQGPECRRVRDVWLAIGAKVPQLTSARVGAVDCDAHKELCKKQEVGHMPFVRRYKSGKRKTYYGDWDIDSVMKFVTS